MHINKAVEEIGAGDQGHMFGYASDETPEYMPLTHQLATRLGARLTGKSFVDYALCGLLDYMS